MSDHVRGSTPDMGKLISVYNQPPRSTQPGHPSIIRCSEYQQLWSEGSMVHEWVAGITVIPLLSQAISDWFSSEFIPQ